MNSFASGVAEELTCSTFDLLFSAVPTVSKSMSASGVSFRFYLGQTWQSYLLTEYSISFARCSLLATFT